MFKTLVSLVLAMSACAAFLSWMEPPDPTTAALTDVEFSRQQARTALAMTDGTRPLAWEGVNIVAMPESQLGLGRAGLAATRGYQYHFIISRQGLVHAGRYWREQSNPEGVNMTIVVALGGLQGGNSLTVAQWLGLRALLIELADSLANTGQQPWIRLGASASSISPGWLRTLRTWLESDGFLR
ncbi:MAG: hypothetical protein V3W34_10340 [Phycisphaerae bacterium]